MTKFFLVFTVATLFLLIYTQHMSIAVAATPNIDPNSIIGVDLDDAGKCYMWLQISGSKIVQCKR